MHWSALLVLTCSLLHLLCVGCDDGGESECGGGSFCELSSPDIALSTATVHFGQVPEGVEVEETLIIANEGTAELVLSSLELRGLDADRFTVLVDGEEVFIGQTLTIAGWVANEGPSSRTVALRYTAEDDFGAGARLLIRSNDPDESFVVVDLGVDAMPALGSSR